MLQSQYDFWWDALVKKGSDSSAQILGLESQELKISCLNNLSIAAVCLCLPGICNTEPSFLIMMSTAKPAMVLYRETFITF